MKFSFLSAVDVERILAIQKDNFSDGWNGEMLLSAFKNGNFYTIELADDNAPVGLITYSISFDTADIEGVVVDKAYRQKGYGGLLLQRVLLELKEKGVERAILEVRKSNLPAIRLYSAQGFKQISVRNKYYSDGEDAVVMIKELL